MANILNRSTVKVINSIGVMLEGWVEHRYTIIHVRCPFMIYTKNWKSKNCTPFIVSTLYQTLALAGFLKSCIFLHYRLYPPTAAHPCSHKKRVNQVNFWFLDYLSRYLCFLFSILYIPNCQEVIWKNITCFAMVVTSLKNVRNTTNHIGASLKGVSINMTPWWI